MQANVTDGIDTVSPYMCFGKRVSEFSTLKAWLVRDAQIRDGVYVTDGSTRGM